ncbi:ESPR-type extended signal peptide-containing protein [Burkholderia vietnamiensis]|uniref:ESPR-type extended signal peptide-containing protein n=1 Tax=Burkholderia vietnamiensis TaxID=60552 RepID=UPI001B8EB027|nr:ESPR-type extended signal peptide-containing protein [Burkholderia vietnamiensis]MBR8033712.1 hypothetical protein [Burkholderia vietnamiensis]
MNKIFKVIWCKAKAMFVVASELATARGASGGTRVRSGVGRADNEPPLSRIALAVSSALAVLSFGLGFAPAAHAQTVMPAIDTSNATIQTSFWSGGGNQSWLWLVNSDGVPLWPAGSGDTAQPDAVVFSSYYNNTTTAYNLFTAYLNPQWPSSPTLWGLSTVILGDPTLDTGNHANTFVYGGVVSIGNNNSFGGATARIGNLTNVLGMMGAAVNANNGVGVGAGSTVATGATNGLAMMGATATGVNTVAIGKNANTAVASDVAIGAGAKAAGAAGTGSAVSIGAGNTASGAGAVAIGDPSIANGTGAIAMGFNSIATADGTATGGTANGAVALGDTAVAAGQGSVSIGNATTAGNAGSIALGDGALVGAGATKGIALGSGANASVANSVALGNGSTTTAGVNTTSFTVGSTVFNGFAGTTPATAGVVSVGSAGAERQIQNVAAGRVSATSTDAVNGSQLYSVASILNAGVVSLSTSVGSMSTSVSSMSTSVSSMSTTVGSMSTSVGSMSTAVSSKL